MEEKKEYLNEETYQRTKKKITKLSVIIFIIGITIGIGLITLGIIKNNNAQNEQDKLSKADSERLTEINNEKHLLNNEYYLNEEECNNIDTNDSNWFSKKTTCQNKSQQIMIKINNLGLEEFKLRNKNYNTISHSNIYFLFGGFVIFVSIMLSSFIYVIAKKREITAFAVQQKMPIVKEGIESMAPTIGDAVGTITKEALDKSSESISNLAKDIADNVKNDKK